MQPLGKTLDFNVFENVIFFILLDRVVFFALGNFLEYWIDLDKRSINKSILISSSV